MEDGDTHILREGQTLVVLETYHEYFYDLSHIYTSVKIKRLLQLYSILSLISYNEIILTQHCMKYVHANNTSSEIKLFLQYR